MHNIDDIFRLYRTKVMPYADVGIRVADSSLHIWLEYMFECFGNVAGMRALDFGAASGHKAMLLAILGARTLAIDLADESIIRMKHARHVSGIHFDILQGDVRILQTLDASSFDLILCAEVIEHMPEEAAVVFRDEAIRLLHPGGKLFVTTPNFDVYGPAEESPEYIRRTPFGHYKHYRAEELVNLFGKPPLQIIQSWYQCHPLTLRRNRLFYPLAYYDNALYVSRRYPLARRLLRPLSWIYHAVLALSYPVIYRLHRAYENHWAIRPTGLTIMLDVKRGVM